MSRESLKRNSGGESPEGHRIEDGIVLLTDGATTVVRTKQGDVRAARAASCLIEPAARDRVMLGIVDGEAFIVAILVREDATKLAIMHDGPVQLVSRTSSVSVVAAEDVSIVGKQSVGIVSADVTVDAEKASVTATEIGVVGKIASISAGVLRSAADTVERTAGRLVERLGRSYRFVEETEHVRAKELDLRADGALSLRAEHAVVLARKIVKVDGTQIHMG